MKSQSHCKHLDGDRCRLADIQVNASVCRKCRTSWPTSRPPTRLTPILETLISLGYPQAIEPSSRKLPCVYLGQRLTRGCCATNQYRCDLLRKTTTVRGCKACPDYSAE